MSFWENAAAGLTGIPFPLFGSAGQHAGGLSAGGFSNALGQFADSPVGKLVDPQGFMKQYNPFGSDEDKYGSAPGEFNPDQYGSQGYGPVDRMYSQQLGGLMQNVDPNDPYMQSIMNQAGAGASQDAKMRGLTGPYSVNANEQARMRAGLGYAQQENARRQGLAGQMMGQYGDLNERRRQFNSGMAYDRYKSAVDAYNQRVAGHNSVLNTVPRVGPGMNAAATSRNSRY